MLGTRLLILLQPPNHPAPVIHRQKLSLIGKILHHPKRRNADDDGDQALQDEDPRPPGFAGDAVHLRDRGGEQAAKGARNGGGGEEDGGAHTELGALVPAAEIVIDAGEQTRLGQTEKPARRRQSREIGHQAHERHTDAPGEHDGWDEDAGTPAFEQDLGEGFEEGVGDEEDGQGEVVLAVGHMQVGLEALDLGVADVGAVEEGDEVEEAEPGD
jgi:hypothetical protein